ncbi:MAG: hypothetical protein KAX65_01365 [Caldilineaceae bacterium]|nr:hypothetical protein [Caldilineaceae bacterium]
MARRSDFRVSSVGGGGVVRTDAGLRFVNPPGAGNRYCNAQIDDYQGLARRNFRWRPPLRLRVDARFSHAAGQLRGTAGFGFWNDPFWMTGRRVPALPAARWFFYASPPSDMALAHGVPGAGWKAATLDARSPWAAAQLPLLALAMPLLRAPRLHARLWPRFQRALHIAEAPVGEEMTAWQTYELVWQPASVHFTVNGRTILTAPAPPGPLGLVVWLDNQWLVARPDGRLGGGVLTSNDAQWMEIGRLEIARLASTPVKTAPRDRPSHRR